jgi:hydrogenase nickel incorporation protein HypA/HybF
MHELGIANSILESVREEMQKHAGARLHAIGLRIGEWSGVEPESLRFCFGVLARETCAAGAELKIEMGSLQWRCRSCHKEFTPAEGESRCPDCGASYCRLVSGQQLEIAYLDLEEP